MEMTAPTHLTAVAKKLPLECIQWSCKALIPSSLEIINNIGEPRVELLSLFTSDVLSYLLISENLKSQGLNQVTCYLKENFKSISRLF